MNATAGVKEEERILPGKSVSVTAEDREKGDYDNIGKYVVTCPFCWNKIYSTQHGKHDKCPHFYRITGGCGVSAAFYFYNPPRSDVW